MRSTAWRPVHDIGAALRRTLSSCLQAITPRATIPVMSTNFRPATGRPSPPLDGIEEKWVARVGKGAGVQFDRTKSRDSVYAHRHSPADSQRVRCTSGTFSRLPTRTPSARFQRMRAKRKSSTRSAGRQRAADRAPGAELLRRPVRPVTAVDPGSSRPRRHRDGRRGQQIPIVPADTGVAAATRGPLRSKLTSWTSGPTGSLAAVGCAVDWSTKYRTIDERSPCGGPARLPA